MTNRFAQIAAHPPSPTTPHMPTTSPSRTTPPAVTHPPIATNLPIATHPPVATNRQSLIPAPCWYAAIYQPPDPARSSDRSSDALCALAQDFSPRYQAHRDDLLAIDISGLDRLFGDPRRIGEELRRSALARRLHVQIAIAATRTAAMLLAVARPGVTVIGRGEEGAALAPLPLGLLDTLHDDLESGVITSRVAADGLPGTTRPPARKGAASQRKRGLSSRGLGADRTRSGGETGRYPQDGVVLALKQWGLRTVGELAALPADALAARLGQQGLTWHALARGHDVGPMVPTRADERFVSSVELEWPIEGLEPLSFVLTRLLEPLSTRLERRDRGAAVLHVTLGLILVHDIQRGDRGDRGENSVPNFTGDDDQCEDRGEDFVHNMACRDDQRGDRKDRRERVVQESASSAVSASNVVSGDTYTRSLQLPSPIRDVRTLRTLILLDLESHPPAAPIERVDIVIDPTPGRVLPHALFVRAPPTAEQLSTLVARLHALMGEDRVGHPAIVDSYRPGAFAMKPFPVHDDQRRDRGDRRAIVVQHPASSAPAASSSPIVSALRRCRHPVPARVSVAEGRPVAVTTDRRGFAGGRVVGCAGPWRSSGQWWERLTTHWDFDQWDVSLSDGAIYRIFKDRVTDRWFIDAIVD
jgi:impB/mucB/samB family